MKRLIIILCVGCFSLSAYSQQEILVTQYMFNGLFINPAYAGSHKFWEATALHRSQWVNLDGAPVTQMIEFDGPISNDQLGVGFIVLHDDIGDTEQFEFSANGSYHLNLDSEKKNRLAFGIRAGFTNYSFRFDETNVFDEGDAVFETGISNKYVPKFGLGAYFYSDRFYAGVSVPTLYASDDNISIDNTVTSNGTNDKYFENHVFFNTGYVFDLGANLKLKPNVLVKYHPSAPWNLDFNANLLIYEKVWFGLAYRTAEDFIGLMEVNVTPQIRIGYAYDLTLSDIADYSNGSHEVMLGYNFGKDVIKMRSPRYF